MQLGSKSIVEQIIVRSKGHPNVHYTILVQANKNKGICGIQVVNHPEVDTGKIFSQFQGQQINDPNVLEEIEYEFYKLLFN